MPLDSLTDQQRAFIDAHITGGFFNRKKDAKTVKSYETYLAAEAKFKALALEIPKENPKMAELIARLRPALDAKAAGQFDTASDALDQLVLDASDLKLEIGTARTAMLQKASTFEATGWATPNGQKAIEDERTKVAATLAAPLPKPADFELAQEQLDEMTRLKAVAQTELRGDRTKVLQDVTQLTDPDFAADAAKLAIEAERQKARAAMADELPSRAQFTTARQAIAAAGQAVLAEKQRVIDARAALQGRLVALADPAGASPDEKKGMKAQRDEVARLLTAETPLPAQMAAAAAALDVLGRLVKESSRLSALASKNPGAAREARTAFKTFKAQVGDAEVTPQVLESARTDVATKTKASDDMLAEWRLANKMPARTEEESRLRQAELDRTASLWNALQRSLKQAKAKEHALTGHDLLTKAVAHGPLSAESGRPFKAATAENLIKGFVKNPKLADAAVKVATTALYPDLVAQQLDTMIGRAGDNFPRPDGRKPPDPAFAPQYAERLLKMGGEIGPEFFNRLPAYLDAGHHFDASEMAPAANTFEEIAHKRSLAVASKLVGPDGGLAVGTPEADRVIGDLLFSPDALRNPTPVLNTHILKTMAMFADPVSGPKASALLQDAEAPTNGTAQDLIRTSLGKAPGSDVSDTDTRNAVLSSMLTPHAQGPVGSCFATAPTRRARETQPLDAMKALVEIASTGAYKPAHGMKVAVVNNTSADEDPLLKSWEYSLATSAARDAGSQQKGNLAFYVGQGTDQLQPLVGGTQKEWDRKKAKLARDVSNAFSFTYDPVALVTDANDGSSSMGRYVTKRWKNDQEIRTKDEFTAELADVAIGSLRIDPASVKADEIRALVESDAFINVVCPPGYKPWELTSGGQTEATTRTMFGAAIDHKEMLPASPAGIKPPEGERTTAVLTSFLDTFKGRTDEMVTVTTITMHGFNALPNHPSLAPLKGATPAETARKVKDNLVDKGIALKNTDLSADRAAWMFDEQLNPLIAREQDPALKALLEADARSNCPSAAVKPPALAAAVKSATQAYFDRKAEAAANTWKLSEEAASRPVTPSDLADKTASLRKADEDFVLGAARGACAQELGATEFVIADTNWGGPLDHTTFVIAVDPTTGEPLLWKKQQPPGTLQPAGREWVDDQWTRVE